VPHDKIVDECVEALYGRVCDRGGAVVGQVTGVVNAAP
jgi:hypothetical protein